MDLSNLVQSSLMPQYTTFHAENFPMKCVASTLLGAANMNTDDEADIKARSTGLRN